MNSDLIHTVASAPEKSKPALEQLQQTFGLIPNLAGVKFTFENLMDFRQAQQFADGRYDMLFGRDEMLLSSLPLGTRGAVGSTYNYSAAIYLRVIAAFAAGDMVRACQEQSKANEYIAIMVRYGGMVAAKVIMKLVGVDCGPVRLPLQTLSAAQVEQLQSELDRAGFFEAIAPARQEQPA